MLIDPNLTLVDIYGQWSEDIDEICVDRSREVSEGLRNGVVQQGRGNFCTRSTKRNLYVIFIRVILKLLKQRGRFIFTVPLTHKANVG